MTGLKRFRIQLLIGLYVVLSLGAAAVLSQPTFSFVPLLFLALFIYFRLRPPRPIIRFSLDLYLFLALPLIYEPIIGSGLSPLFSLPLLSLLDSDMKQLASTHHFEDSRVKWQPSKVLVSLTLVIAVAIAIAAFLGKVNLIIACAVLAGYLLFLLVRLFAAMPPLPIEAPKAQHRVVAGHNITFAVPLLNKFRSGSWLYLASPYEWVKLKPDRLKLTQDKVDLQVAVTPPLAGPSSICLVGFVLDRRGLMQYKFSLELAELLVIPRARYASWLARKYLETTKAGAIFPMASVTADARTSSGFRSGTEFYGNRLYEAGDSLHSIDWKHSLKLDELVVKEFDAPRASSAALLVNLTAGDADEADKLVYSWLVTSITLAQEGIPVMLAVYNHDDVLLVTEFLDRRRVVAKSLALSREVEVWDKPQKYLQPPDPLRLRADISRLKMVSSDSVTKLIELLDLEFKALSDYADSNPATKALRTALSKSSSRPTVLFISARNHDEEALQMAKYRLKARNHRFAEISLDGAEPKSQRMSNLAR